MNKYTLETNDREPKPRSRRLRELGGGTSSGSAGATVVNVGGGQEASVDPNSHTHANKSDLDKLGTDTEGYGYITQQREVEETDEDGNTATNWTGVREKIKAGYADRAGVAHDLTPDSPVRDQFLSKIADDVAQGRITFNQGLRAVAAAALEGGLTVGEYVQGAKGAAIDAAGNAEVESITVRSCLKVFELIYNRINALEGTTSFADVGTIDAVEDTEDGQILTMRKRWDGDFTAFQPGDVIYGYVNDLEGDNGGEYFKAWAWVRDVDRTENTLEVARYADSMTPAGVNHSLREGMVITRWGNNVEANAITWANPAYSAVIEKRDKGYFNTRQSSFFISAIDGNIVELMGVNAPILQQGNYGAVLGKLPAGLLDDATEKLINKDQPYLYARGIVVQDLIRVDYNGVVTRTANYRGTWSAETAASDTDYYRSTPGVYDTVTWANCMWQCVTTGTTDEPSDTTGSWVNMSGGVEVPTLSVWKILPNTDIITLRYNSAGEATITPAKVTCEILLTDTDNGTKTYSSSADLQLEHGVKLYYSLDGVNWHDFVIGNAEPLETEDSEAFEAEASTEDAPQYLILGGDDISSQEIGDRIYFELRNDTDVLARNVIAIVKDGYEGKDGLMVYPAGNYSADIAYSATQESSPVVAYDGNYYMLLRGKSYLGSGMPEGRRNPAEDVANGGDDVRWRLFDKFSAVFTDVLMADFAKLGGAIFYGDYMFSQSGTLYGQEVSGADDTGAYYYRKFTDGESYGTFIPHLLINFVTGEIKATKATISGKINATSGSIGGFTISSNHLGLEEHYTGSTAGMSLYPTWLRFQSSDKAQQTLIGSNVLLGTVGFPMLATFTNTLPSYDIYGHGIGVYVTGATYNHAISAKGNIHTEGLIAERGVKVITLNANQVWHDTFDRHTWLIKCSVDNGCICLPDKYEVRDQLGLSLDNTDPFSVRLTIIGHVSCTKTFKIRGRNKYVVDSSGNYFLDKDIYPTMLNNNGEAQVGSSKTDAAQSMGAGDVAEYQLVYDGTDYYAYFVGLKQ